jgi:hypothetical protein
VYCLHDYTCVSAKAVQQVGAWLGSYAVALRSRGVRHVGLGLGPGEVELEAPAAATATEGLWHHADIRRGALQEQIEGTGIYSSARRP